jgi:hypothetical protein
MDEAAWGALALALTLLLGIYTWISYQRRGLAAGVRGAGLTLLPVAAWLTGVLELVTEIGGAIGDWAVDLALSPTMWLGTALGGLAVVLLVVSGVLAKRDGGSPGTAKPAKPADPARQALPAAGAAPSAPVLDDGVDAEIEAILRKRGIT